MHLGVAIADAGFGGPGAKRRDTCRSDRFHDASSPKDKAGRCYSLAKKETVRKITHRSATSALSFHGYFRPSGASGASGRADGGRASMAAFGLFKRQYQLRVR